MTQMTPTDSPSEPTPAQQPEVNPWDGARGRVALYSHDTLGLGHLRRTQKICRALMARAPKLSVLVITGSPHAAIADFPPGVDFVKLPTVKKLDAEEYASRYLPDTFEHTRAVRSEIIAGCLSAFAPDVLLVDHAPHGVRGELIPGLRERSESGAVCILGLRDILDSAERVKALWSDEGVYETLAAHYDQILIYGQQDVFDPIAEYAFPRELRDKSTFCGYITDTSDIQRQEDETAAGSKRPNVVVTIGGGDYYIEEVIGAFLTALESQTGEIPFDSQVFCGAYLNNETLQKVRTRAANLPVEVHGYQANLKTALVNCDLMVGTGGYNTVTEALALAPRALIIPRVTMRAEQSLRAERLSDRGALRQLPPETMTPDSLFAEINSALANPERPLTTARKNRRFNLAGATHVAELITSRLQSSLAERKGKDE